MRLSAFVLFLALLGCGRAPDVRTYELQGQILAVKADTKEVLVQHDDIPGFMPAMTMPYAVKDAALLRERAPGDLITATLNVSPDGSAWLSALAKTGSAPLPDQAPATLPAATNVHVLQPGDAAPDTPLVGDDGTPLTLAAWRGSAIAITFIYTRCPLAEYCPLLDRRFAELQTAAAADPDVRGRIRLVSVSFDPEHDSKAVLAAHARKLGADPGVWKFATAPEAIVDRFAAQFGVNVIRERDGTITHSLRTAVIDPAGRIAVIRDDNSWTAADLLADAKRALGHR